MIVKLAPRMVLQTVDGFPRETEFDGTGISRRTTPAQPWVWCGLSHHRLGAVRQALLEALQRLTVSEQQLGVGLHAAVQLDPAILPERAGGISYPFGSDFFVGCRNEPCCHLLLGVL